MSENLASKYRPNTFEEICHQEYVKEILMKQIETKTFSHSYLLGGHTGCGKTTVARAFANALNKGYGNPIEIDAASNSGVDNIRQLVKEADTRAIDAEYKIYIIDECHSLTSQAWQALLKTIEEPPEYTIFIFCTTEVNKVPDTIKNRCQMYSFTRIPPMLIQNRLAYICEHEGFTNYQESISYISKTCDGSMRNAITKLEKVASFNKDLMIEDTISILGGFSYDMFLQLLYAMDQKDESTIHGIVDWCYNNGSDFKSFVNEFLYFVIDVAKYNLFKDFAIIRIPETYKDWLEYFAGDPKAKEKLNNIIDGCSDLKMKIHKDLSPELTVRIELLRMSR